MDKAALRKKIQGLRKALAPELADALSRSAQERLMALDLWTDAGSVALYVAARHEVQTGLLLENAWKRGKKVYLPKVEPDGEGLMSFALCRAWPDLSPGAFGIMEPLPGCGVCLFSGVNEADSAYYDDYELHGAPDLFILPGLAFDLSGRRLGWGGGFYDRFLAKRAESAGGLMTAVGLAYSFQLFEEIPHDPWDKPVDALCTDKEFLWTRSKHV